jgi:hypothetical protein
MANVGPEIMEWLYNLHALIIFLTESHALQANLLDNKKIPEVLNVQHYNIKPGKDYLPKFKLEAELFDFC